jgi:hypothetical protein
VNRAAPDLVNAGDVQGFAACGSSGRGIPRFSARDTSSALERMAIQTVGRKMQMAHPPIVDVSVAEQRPVELRQITGVISGVGAKGHAHCRGRLVMCMARTRDWSDWKGVLFQPVQQPDRSHRQGAVPGTDRARALQSALLAPQAGDRDDTSGATWGGSRGACGDRGLFIRTRTLNKDRERNGISRHHARNEYPRNARLIHVSSSGAVCPNSFGRPQFYASANRGQIGSLVHYKLGTCFTMENGSSGRPIGARAFDQMDGQPRVSELDNEPVCRAQPGDRPNRTRIPAELAAAIAEIKELYEREIPLHAIDGMEREHQLPRQQADSANFEREATQAAAEAANARAARAIAALASEHETRLAAEVELSRVCAEVEGERERAHEALQQAQAAGERAKRAEAELKRFHGEVEVWHRQAEQELARLVEEANGLGQRLQAAETEAAQLRQVETGRQSFRGLGRISGASSAVLVTAVAGACMLYFSQELAGNIVASVLPSAQRSWDAAKQRIFGTRPDFEAEDERAAATPVPQSAAPTLKTGQPGARTATAPESGSGQIQILPGVPLDSSALPNRGGDSQSKPEASRDQQHPAIAAPPQDTLPEGKSAQPGSASANVLSEPEHIQPQILNVAQANARAKIEPEQPEKPLAHIETTSSPELTLPPPSGLTSPPNEETGVALVTDAVAAQLSIHYWQGSPSARADAERLAKRFASSGVGTSQLLRTQHVVREPVVRYFFVADAGAATRIVGELRKAGGNWRVEDCTHYRHKPPAGTIQVWPIQ